MRKFLLGIGLTSRITATAVLAAFSIPALAQDESLAAVGTWQLNISESIPPQGRNFQPFQVIIREAGAKLAFTQTEMGPDGKMRSFSHETPTDGVERLVPEFPGAKMTMTLLPSGAVDAKLKFPNGARQNKVCIMQPGFNRQICFASVTATSGEVVFFKQVLDRVR